MAVLKGRVTSGAGNFSFWIEKLSEHYLKKTGLRLYPGTLNVLLDEPYSLPARRIRLEAEEYGGTVSVNAVPCRIFAERAVILRTDLNESGHGLHPKNVVEVACEVRLREKYGLLDGDEVEVEVPEEGGAVGAKHDLPNSGMNPTADKLEP